MIGCPKRKAHKPEESRSDRDHRSAACSPDRLGHISPNFPFSSAEAKSIGAPIGFIVFGGMDVQNIEKVIFVEVKSGSARLDHNKHAHRPENEAATR